MRQFVFVKFAVLLAASGFCYGQKYQLNSVGYGHSAGQEKLTFGLTGTAKYHYFTLDKPKRLVIDLDDTEVRPSLAQPTDDHPAFGRLRIAAKTPTDLRLVVPLKEAFDTKNCKINSGISSKNQLVFTLATKDKVELASKNQKTEITSDQTVIAASENGENIVKAANTTKNIGKKRFVVAIDAGHGGDDPGAHGPNGTHEKQVTLAIARKLEGLINGQSGMKAKLVRKGDYYVGLRDRMKIARKAKADLFISIHADAVKDAEVRGASVYTLSSTGASSEAARWLANSENAKEKVGGVPLNDKEDVVAKVLLDLSQTATQQASLTLAEKVLKNFRTIGGLHYTDVQSAGFAVLKSPDIPSILVETAYISNPSDELNLQSPRYQNKIAAAIFKGVLGYFMKTNPVDNNRMAKL